MKRTFLALGLLLALAGCATFRSYDPHPTAAHLDIDRFMGKWYVIGSTPPFTDRDHFNAVETYQRADRGILITYQYDIDRPGGDSRTTTSRAMINNPGINTDWRITRAWPFGGDAQIVHLAADYSVAAFASADKKRAWIIARRRQIDDPLYSDIILLLQDLGINVGKIRLVPHG